jgi:chemotaxis protein MotB
MAGHGGKKKGRRQRHDDHGEHADERWLLTYSDLITLLMALFMVLFSISSVNKSKFESLQHALQDAGSDAAQLGFAHARRLVEEASRFAGVCLVAPFRRPLRVLELLS